jgi:hypothetical protein
MRNFPHQFNQIPKLNSAVAVFVRLADAASELDDDGVVGDALARAGVYAFRYARGRSVAALLAEERHKPASNQGTRTSARDLRRFFSLLGFIIRRDNGWEASASGRALVALDLATQGAEVRGLWRQALLEMVLDDDHGSSHPYRILLRLVADKPGLAKPLAGLCLEANSDDEREYRRIRALANSKNPVATMEGLAGPNTARNSIKILPALAEQLGDITNQEGRLYLSGQVSEALDLARASGAGQGGTEGLLRRPVAPHPRVPGGRRRELGGATTEARRYDPDALAERINAHEACLDAFSQMVPRGVEQMQASYDLLLVDHGKVVLVECKTIRDDAHLQVRLALGQLLYYEYFDVAPAYPGREVQKLLLSDRQLPIDLSEFLAQHGVATAWLPSDGQLDGTDLAKRTLADVGIRL